MSREAGSDYLFFETDTGTIVSALIDSYEKITGRTVQPASVDRLFLAWVADVITQVGVQINYCGNQNIPSRAEGENLDALAELFFTNERPAAKAASVTMRFTISEAQDTAILVPGGTRITTAGASIIFVTKQDVYIPIGETSVEVGGTCETEGAAGNGYAIGQINRAVDLFPYYESCTNIDVSDGGADEASDDEFYDILRMSEDAYSNAGARGGYIYFAKSVSTEIEDVKAIQPSILLSKSLTGYDRHAFIGGDGLKASTLKVYPHGMTIPATIAKDYQVDFDDGLLTISVAPGGILDKLDQIDVEVETVMAGRVHIYVLMNDGTIATSTIKDLVYAACNADFVRPLTDLVSVEDPRVVPYDIKLTYYIPSNSTRSAQEIEAAVERAVNAYTTWQSARLGRDINPSMLISKLMETGIKRVDLIEPVFTLLSDGSDNHAPDIAQVGSVTVTNGGYEDE